MLSRLAVVFAVLAALAVEICALPVPSIDKRQSSIDDATRRASGYQPEQAVWVDEFGNVELFSTTNSTPAPSTQETQEADSQSHDGGWDFKRPMAGFLVHQHMIRIDMSMESLRNFFGGFESMLSYIIAATFGLSAITYISILVRRRLPPRSSIGHRRGLSKYSQ